MQEVEDADPWPKNQRFDYLVREKLLRPSEAATIARQISSQPNEYKAVIVKTLKILTNKEPREDTYEAWRSLVGLNP